MLSFRRAGMSNRRRLGAAGPAPLDPRTGGKREENGAGRQRSRRQDRRSRIRRRRAAPGRSRRSWDIRECLCTVERAVPVAAGAFEARWRRFIHDHVAERVAVGQRNAGDSASDPRNRWVLRRSRPKARGYARAAGGGERRPVRARRPGHDALPCALIGLRFSGARRPGDCRDPDPARGHPSARSRDRRRPTTALARRTPGRPDPRDRPGRARSPDPGEPR